MRRKPRIDAKDPFRGRSILLPFGLLIAVFATLFSGVRPAAAATAIWTQTDWSGGLDGGTGAVHPTDQAGWTRYASVNGMSGTASPGNALLSTQAFTATDDGTLTTTGIATGGGFGNGTTASTVVAGSGTNANVKLVESSSVPVNAFETTMPPVPALVGDGGRMIRNGADDAIYVLQGGGTGFLRYSVSGNAWTTLAPLPAAVGSGSAIIRDGASDSIYVLRGTSTGFYRYSISANAWTTLAVVPAAVGNGGNMIRNGSDDAIYVVAGSGTGFYRYSISADAWTTLAAAPGNITSLGLMNRNGSDDTIYVLRGGTPSNFFRYSIAGNSWTLLAAAPAAIATGAGMTRNGGDDVFYVSQGNGGTGFYRYSISGNSWTSLAASAIVGSGGGMIRNGTDDAIYLLAGANSTAFRRYSITANAWTTLLAVPGAVRAGAAIIRDGASNDIYVLQGGATGGINTEFHRYSVSGNSWQGSLNSTLSSAPLALGAASVVIRNGSDDDIYVLRGTSTGFYRYSISTNAWTTLASVPNVVGAGAAMVRDGASDSIYVLRGNSNGFYRYSISANAWTTLATLPLSVSGAGMMIRDGASDHIYVLQGAGASFYRYSISANAWTTLAAVPASVNNGGLMLRNGSDDDIYVLQGNNATGFFRYSISGDAWTTLTPLPSAATGGTKMIRDGASDVMYLLQSNGTGFSRYSISANAWTTLAVVPGAVSSGAAMIRDGASDAIYVLRGNSTSNFYRYSVSGNAWTTLASVPQIIGIGSAMFRDGAHNHIYILPGNSTVLWRYVINAVTYPSSGTFTSAVIDTGGAASFGNLSWTATLPLGTTLTFATRSGMTATPDGSWSAWSAELSNSIGSAIASPTARYIQYRGTFGTTAVAETPTLKDLTVAYLTYRPSGDLTSSSFDAVEPANRLTGLSWIEDAALPAGTTVTVSLRTAPDLSSLTGSWSDFTYASTGCGKTGGTVTCSSSALPSGFSSGGDDRYLQYKLALTSTDRAATPTVGSVAITYGVPSSGAGHGRIIVTKRVINDDGGTKSVSDFPLFVNGTPVVSGEPNDFPAPAAVYTVTETGDAGYARTFSGDCDADGRLALNPGDQKVCIVTNDDIAASPLPPDAPQIRIMKVPTPVALLSGGGIVTYDYTLTNPGTVPLSDVRLTDDKCAPVVFRSGDADADTLLDPSEAWSYDCTMRLDVTTVNVAVATGLSGGMTASATMHVEVGVAPSSPSYSAADALASASTIDIDMGLIAVDPASAPCLAGSRMKLADDGNPATQVDSAVYYCGIDGKRYVFTDAKVYFSWFNDFSGIRIVSADALAAVPLAGNATYRPGSRLLKIESDPKTYAVARGAVLRWVTSEAAARVLYGSAWNTLVIDIPVSIFAGSYRIGDPISLQDAVSSCVTSMTFTADLAIGSSDPQVRPLQDLLRCLGHFPADLASTGYFGATTEASVKAFQTANGLAQTGTVGPTTRDALNRYTVR
jgi:hypothetical protein